MLEQKYSDTHEWISVEAKTQIGTVGITDYAQKALGDVVYVELPKKGDTFEQHGRTTALSNSSGVTTDPI